MHLGRHPWVRIESSELFYRADYLEVLKNETENENPSVSELKSVEQRIARLNGYQGAVDTEISAHAMAQGMVELRILKILFRV
ncbi:MAG: DUF2098 domain-containing protein [Euryarchaeota archaeon]|nr:DUF2098 domain-containing protein [Euryarchaeota archaeon]